MWHLYFNHGRNWTVFGRPLSPLVSGSFWRIWLNFWRGSALFCLTLPTLMPPSSCHTLLSSLNWPVAETPNTRASNTISPPCSQIFQGEEEEELSEYRGWRNNTQWTTARAIIEECGFIQKLCSMCNVFPQKMGYSSRITQMWHFNVLVVPQRLCLLFWW